MGYIDRTLKILADKFAQDYVNWILSESFRLVEKLTTSRTPHNKVRGFSI